MSRLPLQLKMNTPSDQTMMSSNEAPHPQEPNVVKKPRKKKVQASQVSPSQAPTQELSDPDGSPVGCFGLLKKISCTLHCGGTTCSVKETASGGTSYDPLSSSSTETSSEPLPVIEKKRKRAVRTGSSRSSQSSERPKKRARPSRAKAAVPVDNHVHSTH